MKEPKFNPEAWVWCQLDRIQIFGQIRGGLLNPDEEWLYFVSNPQSMSSSYTVKESQILSQYKDGWKHGEPRVRAV